VVTSEGCMVAREGSEERKMRVVVREGSEESPGRVEREREV
jgi:hypothetical protein